MQQLTSKEIYIKTAEVGILKTSSRLRPMFFGAVLAGIYISLGAIANLSVVPFFPAELRGLALFTGGILFSIAIMGIVFAGGELFNGNTLLAVGFFRGHYSKTAILKNNLWVLLGNLVGTTFMALLMSITHINRWTESSAHSHEYLSNIVSAKTEMFMYSSFDIPGWFAILSAAVLCNIIAVLVVWMVTGGKSMGDKPLIMIVGITVFVVSGYEHVVANGYFFAKVVLTDLFIYGIFNFELFVAMLLSTVIVAIGNFIGGGLVIGGLYHLVHKE